MQRLFHAARHPSIKLLSNTGSTRGPAGVATETSLGGGVILFSLPFSSLPASASATPHTHTPHRRTFSTPPFSPAAPPAPPHTPSAPPRAARTELFCTSSKTPPAPPPAGAARGGPLWSGN